MEEKKKKKKQWLVILLALLCAGGLTAGGLVLGPKLFKQTDPTVSTDESTEEPTTEPEKTHVELFWNVDRDYYFIQNPTEAGLSSRKKGDDGYYHILFAGESGRSSQRKVKDARLMNQIDAQRVMALEVNDKGEVTGIKTLEDLGYSFIYDRYYVAEVLEDGFILDSSSNYNGIEEEVKLGDFLVIDVSGFNEAESVIGQQMKCPRMEDRVVGVADDEGNIVSFFVIERTEDTPTITKYCEHCGMEVKWKGWAHDDSLPTTGSHYTHYYLTKDVQLPNQQMIAVNTKLCVDLNGHAVDSPQDMRVYVLSQLNVALYLMDHSEGQTGVMRSHGSMNGAGGVICVSKGEFELYSGTLDGSDFKTLATGGAVYVSAVATFKMYGGTIIGGEAYGNRYITTEYKEASRGGVGGSVIVMGKMEMNGGTIKNGKATGEPFKTTTGVATYVATYGGNIYVTKTGTLTMNGGVIEDGTVMNMGGNICLAASTEKDETHATFIMNGGTIRNGKNTRDAFNGGNVVVNTGAEFVMNGGTISGGVARNCAGNIYVNGSFTMNGGRITGGVCMDNSSKANKEALSANVFLVHPQNATFAGGQVDGYVYYVKQDNKGSVTLTGSPVIKGGKYNFYVGPTMEVNVKNLQSGAYIGVTASDYFTTKVDSSVKQYFHADAAGVAVAQYNGKLFLGTTRCVCGGALKNVAASGHTCKYVPFKAWSNETSLPITDGNYYLVKDINCIGQSGAAENANIVIDLNGHTVTGAEGKRMYITLNKGSNLTICDSVGGGKIVPRGTMEKDNALGIYVRYGKLTMYGGTIDASQATVQTGGGAAVFVGNMAEGFDMYGGTIIGGTVVGGYSINSGKAALNGGMGGAVVVLAGTTFNMYGGTIKDGIAKSVTFSEVVDQTTVSGTTNSTGGNIYIQAGATMNMKSIEGLEKPVVSGGQASQYGGNICVAGTFTLEDGTVENGSVGYSIGGHTSNGGNIQSQGAGDIYIKGGVVKNGTATNCGGNIAATGSLYVTGGEISGGSTTSPDTNVYGIKSHNIFAIANDATNKKTILFENATIPGDVALYAATNPRDVILKGTVTIEKGTKTGLYVPAGTILDVSELNAASKISVSASGIFSAPTTETVKDCFTSETAGMPVAMTDKDELVIGIYQCACGGYLKDKTIDGVLHTCSDVAWGMWDSATTLPTSSGYYILKNDIVLTTQPAVTTAATIYIDLNGHKITETNKTARALLLNHVDANVVICDSKGGAQIIGTTEKFTGDAGTILVRRGSLTLYNIDVTGTEVTGVAGGIYVYNDCTFKMYGGKIHGGKAAGNGGGLGALSSANIYLYDAEISGNTAGGNGAGFFDSKAKVTISGATKISGNGTDNNSNLYVTTGEPVVLGKDFIAATTEIYVDNDTDGVFATLTDAADQTALLSKFKAVKSTKELSAEFADGVTTFTLKLKEVHKHCVCCGGTAETGHTCNANQEWKALDSLASGYNALESGYYYLTKDVTVDTETLLNGKNITICLNGHKITANKRVLLGNSSAASLTFTDCGKTKGSIEYVAGAECMIYLHNNGTLKTYGVTMTGANATVKNPLVNMYAGAAGTQKLEAYGTTFVATKENANGGVVTLTTKSGVTTNQSISLTNCTLSGGNVTNNGGLIYTNGVLTIKDSVLKDSKAKNYGGAIYGTAASDITLENTEVKGCQSAYGAVYTAGGKLTLKGTVAVTENKLATDTSKSSNIFLSGATIALENITDIKAGISMTTGGAVSTVTCESGKADEVASKVTFTSDDATKTMKVQNADTYVKWTLLSEGMHLDHCVCCGLFETTEMKATAKIASDNGFTSVNSQLTCKDETWKELADINTLASQASGYYYLTSDQTLTSQQTINGKNIVLCLNGHTVTAKNRFLLGNSDVATLTITDCATNPGTIKWETAPQTLIFLHNYGNFKMYGGIIDGSEGVATGTSTLCTVIYAMAPSATAKAIGTVEIYGGKIIGFDSVKQNKTGSGSTIYMAAKRNFYMLGGEITGGKNKTTGGNVQICADSVGKMFGGTISAGTCEQYGGNVSIDGSFYLAGGEIIDGVANKGGGNIRVGGTFQMAGGVVKNGTATNSAKTDEGGGNININSGKKADIYGGTITGGSAFNGGNIRSAGTLNIISQFADPITITDGTCTNNGGNIIATGGEATIGGRVIITGGKKGAANNNLYAANSLNNVKFQNLHNTSMVYVSTGFTSTLAFATYGGTNGDVNTRILSDHKDYRFKLVDGLMYSELIDK